MVVLNVDDIKSITDVIEYIVERNDDKISVKEVKKKFGLSSEEYEMCMDLAMPVIRKDNELRYVKAKLSLLPFVKSTLETALKKVEAREKKFEEEYEESERTRKGEKDGRTKKVE